MCLVSKFTHVGYQLYLLWSCGLSDVDDYSRAVRLGTPEIYGPWAHGELDEKFKSQNCLNKSIDALKIAPISFDILRRCDLDTYFLIGTSL